MTTQRFFPVREYLVRLRAKPALAWQLLGASLLINILGLGSSLFTIQVLNRYVSHGIEATLVTLTAGVLLAIGLELGFREIRLRFAQALTADQEYRMATDAFERLTGARIAALEQLSPSVRRETLSGLSLLQQAYGPNNLPAVLDLPFALLFLGALFLIDARLCLAATLFVGVVFLFVLETNRRLHPPTREMDQAGARTSALVNTALIAADGVRAFTAAPHLRRQWRTAQERLLELRRRLQQQQGLASSVGMTASSLLSVIMIVLGARLTVGGEMEVGTLIGTNILAGRALALITRFAQLGSIVAQAEEATAKLLDLARLPMEPARGSALTAYQGGLTFKDLGFSHPGAPMPLFQSLSLTVQPGQMVVVAGGNGAGKTSLARLLVGLLEPNRGQILVDGLELRQAAPEWWRKQVVYFPQEPIFLDGTVRENLLTLNSTLDERGLNRIIDAAGLRRHVSESRLGLDSPLFGGGSNLALGIRRRLALARALAGEGRLVVFDEPAEGLDGDGVALVLRTLAQLRQEGRTVVVCTHDLRLGRNADILINLDPKPEPEVTFPASAAKPPVESAAPEPARPAAVPVTGWSFR